MHRITALAMFGLLISFSGCSVLFKRVNVIKDIEYVVPNVSMPKSDRHKLDIYKPKNEYDSLDVLIFIHGGNWNSGDKGTYGFFGNRLARKGIVAVVINYRLSPAVQYNDMALDAAMATKWVYKNIQNYGGNPESIFVSGHSAGGHLASLIALDNQYFDSVNIQSPLKGVVLIDAAGLDMYSYLKQQKFENGKSYLKVFTNDPKTWKLASPINYVKKGMLPFLIYLGGKTYPSILKSNEAFLTTLECYSEQQNFKLQKKKRHIPMIVQFLFTLNPRYSEILNFMNNPEGFSFRKSSSSD